MCDDGHFGVAGPIVVKGSCRKDEIGFHGEKHLLFDNNNCDANPISFALLTKQIAKKKTQTKSVYFKNSRISDTI